MFISVVIPTYNRKALVLRALSSVYQQTRPADEVIVVDDGSEDGTVSEVSRQYPAVSCLTVPHRGVSAARNRGIKQARGNWIAFLDSDDTWHPDKLARQLDYISHNPNASLVHCDERWLRNGKPLNQKAYHEKSGGDLFARSLHRCLISPSAVMIKTELFTDIGVFDEDLPACEDYDLWLRICAKFPIDFVPEKLLTKYGGHADQLSKTIWGLDRFRIQSLWKIISSDALTETQQSLATAMLQKKLNIFLAGARKRGNLDGTAEYVEMLNKISA